MEILERHILFVCSRLDVPGGIERAIVNTANLFYEHRHTVTILILDETVQTFYPLHKGIQVSNKHLHFGITKTGNALSRKIDFLTHLKELRKEIKHIQPHLIITTEYQFTIASKIIQHNADIKIISWEHHHFNAAKKNLFWNTLFRKFYPKVDTIVCLNKKEAALSADIGCTTAVIPNFISSSPRGENATSKTLLTIGWLTQIKGADRIAKIAEKVFSIHPDRQWKLIGEGPLLQTLQMQLEEKGLTKNVIIQAPTSPFIMNEYKAAALYVMTSRFECFPMVLLEAMACGLPAVSFDCPTGPGEIITNNIDGILVTNGDEDEMAATIIRLIEDQEKRETLGENAFQNIQRFSPEKIYRLWEQLFQSL